MAIIDLRSNLSWYAQFPLGNRINAEVSGFNGSGKPVIRGNSRFKLNDNLSVSVGIGGFGPNGFWQPPRPVTNELRVEADGRTSPVSVYARNNQLGVSGKLFDGLLGFNFEHSGKPRTGFYRITAGDDRTYGAQFSSRANTGLADSYQNNQDITLIGQLPIKSSPIQQQYNKFNIQDAMHDPYGLKHRSTTRLTGIQRRDTVSISNFGLGDDQSGVVPELTDYPVGGFKTHETYQIESSLRREAFNDSPKGDASFVKTIVLKQSAYLPPGTALGDPLGIHRDRLTTYRKRQRANFIAGNEMPNYEFGQQSNRQNEIFEGPNPDNNNLVRLSGNSGLGGTEFNSFSGENTSTLDLNTSNLNNTTNLNEPAASSFQQQQSPRQGPSGTNLASLFGTSDHSTTLDSQFGLGTGLDNLRYSYSPNVSTSPYGGVNDPTGQKAFGGNEIIPNLEKDGVGKDTLAPDQFKKSEKREKFPDASGQQANGVQDFQTMDYSDLVSAAKQRNPKTTDNYDFLKKGNYSGKEETLAGKSYDDAEFARNPIYPHARGGSFKGGGTETNPDGQEKYGAMSYDSIPSPAGQGSRSKLSKDNKSAKQPKHGGYHGSYDKPGAIGSIGSSYSPGEGLTLRTEFSDGSANKDGKNPGDMKFKFKSVQGGEEIKFSAFLGSISEAFAPGWNGTADQGRADARYLYESFERTVALDFQVRCFDKSNFKDMWKKLANLAKITYPMYKGSGFHGQICEITVGKLYEGYKCIITDLTYDWDNETSWDLKEHAPMSCAVSISFTILGDQKDGKKFEKDNKIYEGLGA